MELGVAPTQRTARETWLVYGAKTSDCAPLDPEAYPADVLNGRPVPRPDWICRSPDGGMHKDNRVGQIDVHLAAPPNQKDEISWTCQLPVILISRDWLAQIEDLIDPAKTFVGRVFLKGSELPGWATLHEAAEPLLMMKEGWRKSCPICGADNSVMYSGFFFSDPVVLGRRVVVSGNNIFVRKEDAEARGLKPPAGGFEPVAIPYRPEWVAKMRLRTPPDYASRT